MSPEGARTYPQLRPVGLSPAGRNVKDRVSHGSCNSRPLAYLMTVACSRALDRLRERRRRPEVSAVPLDAGGWKERRPGAAAE